MGLETEQIGANTLADLNRQREQIQNTREHLLESEGYTDRSIKTLRGMARRYLNRHCPAPSAYTPIALTHGR